MSEQTIGKLLMRAPPKPYNNSKAPLLNCAYPSLLYGVELEIENVGDWELPGFKLVEDGSLRNGGMEYVSQPMTYSVMIHQLTTFFNKYSPQTIGNFEDGFAENSNYSDRTSIHFHTNVYDLTFQQLANICMLYEVFERLLFNFIGNHRNKNIFCVPWYETQLSYNIVNDLYNSTTQDVGDYVVRRWQKYTALNLLPVRDKCSIEWRHLYGTSDMKVIVPWMRMINFIYAFATQNEHEKLKDTIINLNSNSRYETLLSEVFQDVSDCLRTGNYTAELEKGVLDMKYTLMEPKKKPINMFNDELENHLQLIREAQQRAVGAGQLLEGGRDAVVQPVDPVRHDNLHFRRREVRFDANNILANAVFNDRGDPWGDN